MGISWMLKIHWREWYTKRLMDSYFGNEQFYHMLDKPDIDNPGMRICDDVSDFTNTFVTIFELQLSYGLRLIAFTFVLLQISSKLTGITYLYALGGCVVLIYCFGRP